MKRLLTLMLILVALSTTGCSTPSQAPGNQGNVGRTTPAPTDPASPPPSFIKSDQNLPIQEGVVRQALGAPSPVAYQITVVPDREGRSQADWLKEASGAQVPTKAMVIVVFKDKGYPLEFALGGLFAQRGVTDQEMRDLIAQHYAPQVKAGDPAAGLAKLIDAVNRRLAQ